jgi:hypothetical protein
MQENLVMMRFFTSTVSSLLACILAVFALAAPSHATQVIKWKTLLPKSEPLKDPYSSLTQDQRFDIETIIWARGLSTEERELKHNQQAIDDARQYERRFKQAGIDFENLIKERQAFDIENERRQKLVNNDLNGADIKLAGYLLPLEFSEAGVTDFLLVPYVGACVHVPPPPANQIVFVRLAKKMVVKDLYTPIWITGKMKTKQSSKELNLIDGNTQVTVGYHIDQAAAEVYKE